MPASGRDPRSFVKPVPLPIPTQKGIAIQARSDRVYNPTIPTREHVRKENYDRRLVQMSQQGFRSVNYKPYQGIGDPFYLDHRKLILHALGQWNEGDEDDSSSYTSDNDNEDNMQLYLRKPKSPAKFILKRPRKDLNTLNKEVSHGRNMIRNVRLGHGLFQLIRQERQAKSDKARLEYHKKKQQAMMEWQPPKYDSSSGDETDEELLQDVDLTNYMTSDTWGDDPRQGTASAVSRNRSRVAFQGLDSHEFLELPESRHSKSSLSRPGSKKKKQMPSRPYTPQHAYIGSDILDISVTDYETLKESLFHQLCALHWILEAMNTEAPVAMGPITTCWNFKDLGGAKTTVQKLKRDKLNETKWNAWVSNQNIAKATKRLSTGRLTGRTPRRGNLPGMVQTHRSSISSSSPSGSTSTLNLQIIQPEPTRIKNSVQGQTAIPEDKEAHPTVVVDNTASTAADEEDEALYKKGLFRFLDEYYDSLSREAAGGNGEENGGESGGLNDRSPSPQTERRKYDKRSSENDLFKRSSRKEAEKHSDRYDQTNEKLSSRQLRADALIRAKSSPALLEFVASLPSSKWENLSAELRLRFAEIGEEKALEFHEALEHIERQRLRVLQNKFINMPTGGSSFYRALEEMRSRTAKMDEEVNKKRKASIHQDWYTELLAHIPHEYKLEWQFEKILDKLRRYGLLESGKQSATKFLKVLATLRDWEICCPDIIAAVEFCREKIIEMPIDEFEAWFLHTYPTVTRPQTAPPALKGNERSTDNKEALRITRVSTSAPTKIRYGRG